MAEWTKEIEIPIEVAIRFNADKYTVETVWLVNQGLEERMDVTRFLPGWLFEEFVACAKVDHKFGNWKLGTCWKDTWPFRVTMTGDYDQEVGLENIQAWLPDRRSPDIYAFLPKDAALGLERQIEDFESINDTKPTNWDEEYGVTRND